MLDCRAAAEMVALLSTEVVRMAVAVEIPGSEVDMAIARKIAAVDLDLKRRRNHQLASCLLPR